jgi:hypothetical protein
VQTSKLLKAGPPEPPSSPEQGETWARHPKTYRPLYPSFSKKCAILNSHATACRVTLWPVPRSPRRSWVSVVFIRHSDPHDRLFPANEPNTPGGVGTSSAALGLLTAFPTRTMPKPAGCKNGPTCSVGMLGQFYWLTLVSKDWRNCTPAEAKTAQRLGVGPMGFYRNETSLPELYTPGEPTRTATRF